MFTLAHLSDIHLTPPDTMRLGVRDLLGKRLTGLLNWRFKRTRHFSPAVLAALVADMQAHKPDHTVITGDMVNLALPEEIAQVARWLRNLGPPDEITLVPGNHDSYVAGALEQTIACWGDYYGGSRHIGNGGGTSGGHGGVVFPSYRRIDNIAILGLSSAVPTYPFMATGALGAAQIARAERLLERAHDEGLFRIVLVHHPPLAIGHLKMLTDHAALARVIASAGAELILHGHTHTADRSVLRGAHGSVPVIGVPAAARKADAAQEHPARYNLFAISGQPGQWSCQWRQRGLKRGEDNGGPVHIEELAALKAL